MNASEPLRWLRLWLLDLEQSLGRGVKCSCSRFGAVLDDERKVAGKRTYLTAVVAVVI